MTSSSSKEKSLLCRYNNVQPSIVSSTTQIEPFCSKAFSAIVYGEDCLIPGFLSPFELTVEEGKRPFILLSENRISNRCCAPKGLATPLEICRWKLLHIREAVLSGKALYSAALIRLWAELRVTDKAMVAKAEDGKSPKRWLGASNTSFKKTNWIGNQN